MSSILTARASLPLLFKVFFAFALSGTEKETLPAATPDFTEHPAVINGASELFAQVWGAEWGVGARSAVGMGSLPTNIAVEIEMIVEVDERR